MGCVAGNWQKTILDRKNRIMEPQKSANTVAKNVLASVGRVVARVDGYLQKMILDLKNKTRESANNANSAANLGKRVDQS